MRKAKLRLLIVCIVVGWLGTTALAQNEACCFPDGHCEYLEPGYCSASGGMPQGPGTDCATIICEGEMGACCLPDGTCIETDVYDCVEMGAGTWQGPGTNCETTNCGGTPCDWNPGDPNTKWIQLPDETPFGIDIRVDSSDGVPRIIADDFNCTQSGIITDVHFWGSWKYDMKGEIYKIHLSIHEDDPPGYGGTDPCNPYSQPDEILWAKDFFPGEFTEKPYAPVPDGEWWYDPFTGELMPNADQTIWQYNICIDPCVAFHQIGNPENPKIYWLDIQVDTSYGNEFGWKTRDIQDGHFNDDAVFSVGYKPPFTWQELRYPLGHPYYPMSVDMAFVITTKEEEAPPFITKYVQQPDLSETGIDVDATYDTSGMSPWPPQLLADDFNCTTPGPITDIHIWGSWYNDYLPYGDPRNVEFVLSIHSNIPADPCNPNSYSMPGELLWSRYFGPGDFEVYEEAGNLTEGYYVPCIEYYEYPGDSICWRYDFYMPPLEAFEQQGDPCNPVTYWLDVQAFSYSTGAPVRFGWKTSLDHWMDDAVFAVGVEGDHSPWQELRYPQGHPYYPNSIDLAFAITTQKWLKPKPPVPHLKWSQPPIEIDPGSGIPIYCGWDEPSLLIEPGYWKVVADDFRCLGTMPVTSIHWWGSYVSWEGNEPPMPQPVAWKIGFWSNVPPGVGAEYSYPGELLWQINVPADRVDVNNVGRDYFPQRPSDTCFQYYVRLNPEEYFWQNGDNIFWLSIAAVYPDCACNPDMNCDGVVDASDIDPFKLAMTDPVAYHNTYPNCDINNGDADCDGDIDSADYAILVCLIDGGTTCCPQGTGAPEHPWGWKTRPWHWMDDAVTFWLDGPFEPPVILDPMSNNITPLEGPEGSYDVAFELDTDPNYIKWEQPYTGLRNWGNYTDIYSTGTEYEGELTIYGMAADDWLCQRRTPVSAIVWWGSYMYYQYLACQEEQPAPPPVKPDYFLMSIWTDVPVGDPCNIYGFSHPARKVWEYKARDYDEVMVGYDKRMPAAAGDDDDGGSLEPVFRYSVRLSEEDWFCQPDVNAVYWLSIVAVWNESEMQYSWGWTNHKHVFGDDGVQGWPDYDDPNIWYWDELIDWQTGESRDLSFMLFTEPDYCCKCPDFNIDTIVNFLDYADFADDWLWVGPAGGYNNSDLNCDGSVDWYDVKIFTDQWLDSCP